MKVVTVVGTRPEIIRLSRVLSLLDDQTDHVLVHTGQNHDFELNEVFFRELGLRAPAHYLDAAGETAAQTIGNVIVKSDAILRAERPDAVLVLGDTNSCLAAISAKRNHVPIFHMEAGNRCFDMRVPEEINRRIVDHISDINLTYTEHARRYLLHEGLKPETVICTGSPLAEVLTYYLPQIQNSDVLSRMNLRTGEYFLVSAHREENIESERNFTNLIQSLNAIAQELSLPIVVSTHPRTRKKLAQQQNAAISPLVRFNAPLGLLDYCKLQMNARCVISDSGSITEESSILDFPAVTIREANERPEGFDDGVLVMCGLKPVRVLEALRIVTRQGRPKRRLVTAYDAPNVSQAVLYAILSYTDYVNRTVWYAG